MKKKSIEHFNAKPAVLTAKDYDKIGPRGLALELVKLKRDAQKFKIQVELGKIKRNTPGIYEQVVQMVKDQLAKGSRGEWVD